MSDGGRAYTNRKQSVIIMALQPVRRPDFSNSLTHLTRERSRPGQSAVPAFSVLKEILSVGVIRGGLGFIKGNRPVVCFSEIPLSNINAFADHEQGRYRFYGLVLSKRAVFEMGGRPVIYLPDGDGSWIPDEEKWRQVRYEHGTVDFTHEREWRVLGDVDLRKCPGFYIIVWSTFKRAELLIEKTPVKELIRGILPMEHLMEII
jgi:hypothetical protein